MGKWSSKSARASHFALILLSVFVQRTVYCFQRSLKHFWLLKNCAGLRPACLSTIKVAPCPRSFHVRARCGLSLATSHRSVVEVRLKRTSNKCSASWNEFESDFAMQVATKLIVNSAQLYKQLQTPFFRRSIAIFANLTQNTTKMQAQKYIYMKKQYSCRCILHQV